MSGVDFDTTETAKLGDTTRDWYFLSPEEMKKVMSGEKQMKSSTGGSKVDIFFCVGRPAEA